MFCQLNIRMVNPQLNLSLNELKLIAKHRNISHYENKSAKDLIKALRGSKPKLGTKKNKLKKIKEDLYNLRCEFSKKEADKYRKLFYGIKNYRHFSEVELEETRKNFNELEKSLNFKKPCNNINSVHYYDHGNDKEPDVEDAGDDKYRKIGSVRRLFEQFNRNYYKPKAIDRGFAGEVNNYIKYMSKRDKDEKLSPEEYHNMTRPYLRDLINKHKPVEELNNNNNNNTNNNNNNNNPECGEWKIISRMYINCTSTTSFNETRTMHPKSKQVQVYMGSDTENVIDALFNTLLQNFQCIQETSNERGSEFILDSVEVLEYKFHKIDTIRAES